MPPRPLVAGLLLAAACTSMQPVEPRQFIPAHRPDRISVWTPQDDVVIVTDPQIAGDSLIGRVFDAHWALALNDIVKVEATAPDHRRTALLLGAAAATALGAYLLTNSGKGNNTIPCPPAECGQTVLPP